MAYVATSQVDGPTRDFIAGAAIAAFLRVKPNGTTANGIVVAGVGASDTTLAITQDASLASGDEITCKLMTAQGTFKMTASAAITINALVYGAASGKISSTPSGNAIGVALQAATGDGHVIEVAPVRL